MRKLAPLAKLLPDMLTVRKRADPFYRTAAHRAWRSGVIRRAGGRCEWSDSGIRCMHSVARGDRMFADHIVELSDHGARLDPANGQCLCGAHHTLKTARARAARLGSLSMHQGQPV